MEIIEAKPSDLAEIENLARKVWEPTYRHIVPYSMINLMEENMHRVSAYLQQMEEGHQFFMAKSDGRLLGFATCVDVGEGLRVPKLYVEPSCHHSGVGKALVNFIKDKCVGEGKKFIELNVNRNNKALYFYRRLDFYIHQSIDIPYHGYWMYDYVVRWDANEGADL